MEHASHGNVSAGAVPARVTSNPEAILPQKSACRKFHQIGNEERASRRISSVAPTFWDHDPKSRLPSINAATFLGAVNVSPHASLSSFEATCGISPPYVRLISRTSSHYRHLYGSPMRWRS